MGRTLSESNALSLITNKSVRPLHGNLIWLIEGSGDPRQYKLANVFRGDNIGDSDDGSFKNMAEGKGRVLKR